MMYSLITVVKVHSRFPMDSHLFYNSSFVRSKVISLCILFTVFLSTYYFLNEEVMIGIQNVKNIN